MPRERHFAGEHDRKQHRADDHEEGAQDGQHHIALAAINGDENARRHHKRADNCEKALDRSKYQEEIMDRDVKLHQFKAKIDNEVGNCMAAVEKLRHDIFYSLSGFFFTSAAALLGYLRFF